MKNLNPLVVLEADWRQRLIDDGTYNRLWQKGTSGEPLTPREKWLWKKLKAKSAGQKAAEFKKMKLPDQVKIWRDIGEWNKNAATGEMLFNIEKEPKRVIDKIISAKGRNGSEYVYKNKDVADATKRLLQGDRVKQGKTAEILKMQLGTKKPKKSIPDKIKNFAGEIRKASGKSLGKKGKIGLAVAGGIGLAGLGGLGLYAASKDKK